jgi:hypothetical protein
MGKVNAAESNGKWLILGCVLLVLPGWLCGHLNRKSPGKHQSFCHLTKGENAA